MLSRLKTALRALLRRTQDERELDDELRFHIEQQTEQNIRLGMNPEEARHAHGDERVLAIIKAPVISGGRACLRPSRGVQGLDKDGRARD